MTGRRLSRGPCRFRIRSDRDSPAWPGPAHIPGRRPFGSSRRPLRDLSGMPLLPLRYFSPRLNWASGTPVSGLEFQIVRRLCPGCHHATQKQCGEEPASRFMVLVEIRKVRTPQSGTGLYEIGAYSYWRWRSELSATTMFLSMRRVTLLSTSDEQRGLLDLP